MLGFAIPAGDLYAHTHYRQIPAIYSRASAADGSPLPCFGGGGTGGIEDARFAVSRQGYSPFAILKTTPAIAQDAYAPYTDLMKEVKTGFGRTMSHLPAVFGVSRQTLYNWLNGETPKEQHHDKLVQLAAAARVFIEAGFKPNALCFERVVAQGQSFLELIAQGADGRETAERLVRIEKRGMAARAKLDALLGDRTPSRPSVSDMGRPALDENV
jgi:transcriptional regulator with XRE-family HTH domain